jgi:hypothetical protein
MALGIALLWVLAAPAHGEARDDTEGAAARLAEARQLFQSGTQLVKAAQWYEALGAFERSHALRPHAVTAFNLAACERALGRYTRARLRFGEALAATDPAVPPALADEMRTDLRELDGLLVHAAVELEPADAGIAVDGRPLQNDRDGVASAGLAEPGPGRAAPAARFELIADPGAHLIVLSRPGFSDAVVRVTWAPATRPRLPLKLDRLPAILRVSSNAPRAAVTVDGVDVGVAPLELSRPPGRYRVALRGAGMLPYHTEVTLAPGQELKLEGVMSRQRPSIAKKWWFWTSLGAALTGVALASYFGARAAETPRLDGGGLQWVVQLR